MLHEVEVGQRNYTSQKVDIRRESFSPKDLPLTEHPDRLASLLQKISGRIWAAALATCLIRGIRTTLARYAFTRICIAEPANPRRPCPATRAIHDTSRKFRKPIDATVVQNVHVDPKDKLDGCYTSKPPVAQRNAADVFFCHATPHLIEAGSWHNKAWAIVVESCEQATDPDSKCTATRSLGYLPPQARQTMAVIDVIANKARQLGR